MNSSTKIALAVMGGYVLGRRRKVKLAILLGSVLLGKRLDVRSLGREAWGRLGDSPEFGQIRDKIRDELASSGRSAATAAMSAPLNKLADSLHQRTESLTGQGSDAKDKAGEDGKSRGDRDEAPADEDDESARESDTGAEDEERPRRRRTPARSRSEGQSGRVPRARSGERRRPTSSTRRSTRGR